jgi:hypothetical protein
MAEIRVSVARDRTQPVLTEVEGVAGPSCTALTEPLTVAMGGAVITEELTDEYNQPVAEANQNHLRQS